MEQLIRICNKCGNKIFYKNKGDYNQAIKNNTNCKKCIPKIHYKEKKYSRKCPGCNKELKYTGTKFRDRAEKLRKKCRSCSSPFKQKSNSKLKESLNNLYQIIRIKKECKICNKEFLVTNWNKDKIYCSTDCYFNDSDIKNLKYKPKYNKKACIYFEKLNKDKNWEGQHGMNGGEKKVKKYWVDYYEPNLNIVIEWDENFHNNQLEEDIKRQEEIINFLDCNFYRIKENGLKIIKIDKNKNSHF